MSCSNRPDQRPEDQMGHHRKRNGDRSPRGSGRVLTTPPPAASLLSSLTCLQGLGVPYSYPYPPVFPWPLFRTPTPCREVAAMESSLGEKCMNHLKPESKQKPAYCMIPFICNLWSRQTCRRRKQIAWSAGAGEGGMTRGSGFLLGVMQMFSN